MWPSDSKWAPFNLSGLTQPPGTSVISVYDSSDDIGGGSTYSMLMVSLMNADNAAYENLLRQINSKSGFVNAGAASIPGDDIRTDAFMTTGSPLIYVNLSMYEDEITISATRSDF